MIGLLVQTIIKFKKRAAESEEWSLLTENRPQDLQGKTLATYWDSNRTLPCHSKLMIKTYIANNKCSLEIFNQIKIHNNYLNRLLNGSVIIPGGNILTYIDRKCSQIGVFYLIHDDITNYGKDKAKFQLAYYKACIIRQIVAHPIIDYERYEPLFTQFLKEGLNDNNSYCWDDEIGTFYEMHHFIKNTTMDILDLEIRISIVNIINDLQLLGWAINPIFKIKKLTESQNNSILNAQTVKSSKVQINSLRNDALGKSLIMEQL